MSPPAGSNSTRFPRACAASRAARASEGKIVPAARSRRWSARSRACASSRSACSMLSARPRSSRSRQVDSSSPSPRIFGLKAPSVPAARELTCSLIRRASRLARLMPSASCRIAVSRTLPSERLSRTAFTSSTSTRTVSKTSSEEARAGAATPRSVGDSRVARLVAIPSARQSNSATLSLDIGFSPFRWGANTLSIEWASSAIAGCLTTRDAPLSVWASRSRLATRSGPAEPCSSCRTPWVMPSRSSRASTRKYL